MALVMYLTKVPRYQNIYTDEYETIPIEEIALIDKYFFWTMLRAEGKTDACTMEEWCGIPESRLPHKYVVSHYSDFFTRKKYYDESWGETEGVAIFTQLARIVKANQIFRWFIENVMDGQPDKEYHEVTRSQLIDLYTACRKIKIRCKLVGHDDWNGDHYSVDEEIAREILPLMEKKSFFFGTDTYGSHYAEDVIETFHTVKQIIMTTDFEKETVYFNATW